MIRRRSSAGGTGFVIALIVAATVPSYVIWKLAKNAERDAAATPSPKDPVKPPPLDAPKRGEELKPESPPTTEMRWDDERRALDDCLNLARKELKSGMSEGAVLAIVRKHTITPGNIHLVRDPEVTIGTLYGSNYPPEGVHSRVYHWTRELWLIDKDSRDQGTWLSNLDAYFEDGKLSSVTLEYRYAQPSRFKFLEEDERKK